MSNAAIHHDSIAFHGQGMHRPECVLAHASGLVFAADWQGNGGVAVVNPATDDVYRLTAKGPVRPNGILLEDDGSFLLAHLADDEGGVFRLHPDGALDPVLTEIDGQPLPPTNFVSRGPGGRTYVTVSTRHIPRHYAANAQVRDGFIILLSPGEPPRIVADGLGYTNECVLSGDGATLYVNETFGKATSAFPVHDDGTLGDRTVVARFGEGIFPDGLTRDAEGGLLVTSIISNTVIRLAPNGARTVLVENRAVENVAAVEQAFAAGTLERPLLDAPHYGPLKNISSLAFGGADLRTAYLGCLLGDTIAAFRAPVPGARPPHFDVDIAPLVTAGILPAHAVRPDHETDKGNAQ